MIEVLRQGRGVLVFSALLAGPASYLNMLAWEARELRPDVSTDLFLSGLLAFLMMEACRLWLRSRASLQCPRYQRWERWTYLAFAAPVFGSVGWHPGLLLLLSTALFAVLQVVLARSGCAKGQGQSRGQGRGQGRTLLHLLFFLSGSAALIYQVVWQRLLFAAFGMDSATVTLVVSVFMAGLGLGALAGGWLAARFPQRLPWLFLALEFLIGLFGLSSLWIFDVFTAYVTGGLLLTGLASFALLVIPTLFMGATLPILVTHLAALEKHLGRAMGSLYLINTLGAALAALLVVWVLFVVTGIEGSLILAASLNFVVGSGGLWYARGRNRRWSGP